MLDAKVIQHDVELDISTCDMPITVINRVARTCYKSSMPVDYQKAIDFAKNLKKNGHLSPFEFVNLHFVVTTDRGVTHELVRHRLCSFMQESTRYVNYSGGPIKFIRPQGILPGERSYAIWLNHCAEAAKAYKELIATGAKPQEARSVLPTCTATTLRIGCNLREFMHILSVRDTKFAHPDCRLVVQKMKLALIDTYPVYKELLDE